MSSSSSAKRIYKKNQSQEDAKSIPSPLVSTILQNDIFTILEKQCPSTQYIPALILAKASSSYSTNKHNSTHSIIQHKVLLFYRRQENNPLPPRTTGNYLWKLLPVHESYGCLIISSGVEVTG